MSNKTTAYSNWVKENTKGRDITGKCREFSEKMIQKFPELQLVRGFYICPYWGRREHWWCVTDRNEVIDPTASQFPSKNGEYVPWLEGNNEPTGKCMNCGEYTYNGDYTCSEECEEIVLADF